MKCYDTDIFASLGRSGTVMAQYDQIVAKGVIFRLIAHSRQKETNGIRILDLDNRYRYVTSVELLELKTGHKYYHTFLGSLEDLFESVSESTIKVLYGL